MTIRSALGAVAVLAATLIAGSLACSAGAADAPPEGFSLFSGKDMEGWKVPTGDNGHWKVLDGVIDYDAASEAPGGKDLWTVGSQRDGVWTSPPSLVQFRNVYIRELK